MRLKSVLAAVALFAAFGVASAQTSPTKVGVKAAPIKVTQVKHSNTHAKPIAKIVRVAKKAPKAPGAPAKHHAHKHLAKTPRAHKVAATAPKTMTEAPKAKVALSAHGRIPKGLASKPTPVKKIGKHEQKR